MVYMKVLPYIGKILCEIYFEWKFFVQNNLSHFPSIHVCEGSSMLKLVVWMLKMDLEDYECLMHALGLEAHFTVENTSGEHRSKLFLSIDYQCQHFEALSHIWCFCVKKWVSAHWLFSPRPKGSALPSSTRFLCNFKNAQKWLCNFTISNLHSTISKLRKFANCTEHIC